MLTLDDPPDPLRLSASDVDAILEDRGMKPGRSAWSERNLVLKHVG